MNWPKLPYRNRNNGYQPLELTDCFAKNGRISDATTSQLREDIAQLEAEANMRYVTSIERLAKEEGVQEGLRESIVTILQVRFGDIPPEITHLIKQAEGTENLRELQRQAMVLDSLSLFEQLLADRVQPGLTALN